MTQEKNVALLLEESRVKSIELSEKVDDIQNRLAEILGMTSSDLKDYIENPSNFSPDKWREMEEMRLQEKDKLKKVLAGFSLTESELLNKKPKESKHVKGKQVKKWGKKNWIPLR